MGNCTYQKIAKLANVAAILRKNEDSEEHFSPILLLSVS